MQRRRIAGLALLPLLSFPAVEARAADLVESLRRGRCALLLRHASTTAGIGDPPGFQLAQCSTQRNLSDEGRAQAQRIGAWFKQRGLAPQAVRSSAWCRCKDTADLAFGQHLVWEPLNSTFDDARRAASAAEGTAALRTALAAIPVGRFEVWVTHQVNITALTGESTGMGEGLVVDAAVKVQGRTRFD